MNIGYIKVLFFDHELEFSTEDGLCPFGLCPYYYKGYKDEGDTNSVLKQLSV